MEQYICTHCIELIDPDNLNMCEDCRGWVCDRDVRSPGVGEKATYCPECIPRHALRE